MISAEIEKQIAVLDAQRAKLAKELVSARAAERVSAPNSPDKKIQLFRSLFRGREDVYARRWESAKGSGFSPAKDFYGNYGHMTDAVAKAHLQGTEIAAIYPLLRNEKTYLLAVDFDSLAAANAYRAACAAAGIDCAIEDGRRAWIFFSDPVGAELARKMGVILLARAMAANSDIDFSSYDKMFPSQDKKPKAGFGNYIPLPLQKAARAEGRTIFVDENGEPYPDQWEFLANIRKISLSEVIGFLARSAPMPTECETEPWLIPLEDDFAGVNLPGSFDVTFSNGIYISRKYMPPELLNKLRKLSAFKNPEFYRAQAMGFSTHDKPRVISRAEILKDQVRLPRGVWPEVAKLFKSLKIKADISDQRTSGEKAELKFIGKLRPDQQVAAEKIVAEDIGILSAPTAFGKTVAALGIMAMRGVNTLILVHRSQLAEQWKERIKQFMGDMEVGIIGGGKFKRTGKIDIALIQSLTKREDLAEIISEYGHLVIDECHHLAAFSFENVAKHFRGKHVLGLSATIERKDGHQPVIMMQCGPVVADVAHGSVEKSFEKLLLPRHTFFSYVNPMIKPDEVTISDIYAGMVGNKQRNDMICADVSAALKRNRACIVLSERKDHLTVFENYFCGRTDNMVVLTGGMNAKDRDAALEKIKSTPKNEELLILATGKFLGEGFDEARLDTLFLTMPISWKGTLAQYVGRLNRDWADKKDVRVYDYIDSKIPMITAMYKKRLAGYRALNFIEADAERLQSV